MTVHEIAARGFGRASAEYERGRPGYPSAAAEWLLGALAIEPGTPVLDLAAGTGKWTRELVAAGAEVVAVEPVAEMREALVAALPGVSALEGSAEEVPLPAGAVDAVTVAQAFHWFEPEQALAEIHRVLRPGGRLGLVWNVRDETVDWVRRLTETFERHRGDVPAQKARGWRAAFDATELFRRLESASFHHEHEVDEEAVVARVASISFVAALEDREREGVLTAVRELLRTHPATAGRERFPLPYRTDVYAWERA